MCSKHGKDFRSKLDEGNIKSIMHDVSKVKMPMSKYGIIFKIPLFFIEVLTLIFSFVGLSVTVCTTIYCWLNTVSHSTQLRDSVVCTLFISFLYLYFSVLGDERTTRKHLCGLIHIMTKGEVGTVKHV